jgi:hypothetical protein
VPAAGGGGGPRARRGWRKPGQSHPDPGAPGPTADTVLHHSALHHPRGPVKRGRPAPGGGSGPRLPQEAGPTGSPAGGALTRATATASGRTTWARPGGRGGGLPPLTRVSCLDRPCLPLRPRLQACAGLLYSSFTCPGSGGFPHGLFTPTRAATGHTVWRRRAGQPGSAPPVPAGAVRGCVGPRPERPAGNGMWP